MTPVSVTGEMLNKATIKINASTLSENSLIRESTITHEIGHILGLDDNPPVSLANLSLMSHGRDRTLIYQPQVFDIYNVTTEYNY